MNVKTRNVSTKVFAIILSATIVLGGSLPVSASETVTYDPPTTPMTIATNDDGSAKYITATAHRAASPVLGMLGLNATSGFGMLKGSAPADLEAAVLEPALGIWGSSLNDNPDPYYWNYFYNFYASENNLTPTTDAMLNSAAAASPIMADTTLVENYGNVSVSLSTRPQIVIGVASSASGTDLNGYDTQLDTIHSFTSGSDYYQTGDESYNPKLISYQPTRITNLIDSVYAIADAMETVTAETGAVGRYGDAKEIASDYEDYIYATSAYVMSELAKDPSKKKTVAVVSAKNDDGTYTLANAESLSATSNVRYVEYTALVSDNLADTLGKTTVTAAELAQADAVIPSASTVGTSTEIQAALDKAIDSSYTGMILTTTPSALYGITMNSVENAMGLAYIVGYLYSDTMDIDPVEMSVYYYQNFYHISDLTNVQKIVQVNFQGVELPNGVTTDLSTYQESDVEALLEQGEAYYAAESAKGEASAFNGTYIATAGWDVDVQAPVVKAAQTITGVNDSYAKKVGDAAFTLAPKTENASAAFTFTSDNTSVAAVDAAGIVKIKGAGTANITIATPETDGYLAAAKTVKITVERAAQATQETQTVTVTKAAQTITGVKSTYNKTLKSSAFTLAAKAQGAVTYTSNKTSVVTVGKTTGKVTIKGTGTAKITVKAAATSKYNAATKTITVKVTKATQSISTKKASVTYKASSLKLKKKTFTIGATAKGKVTYSEKSKYITVSKTGKVTVAKNTPKGTYKITVKAAATSKYKAATKTVKIKVK